MALSINTNIMSLQAQDSLQTTGNSLQTAMQRLSSGLQINSAADNPAGYAISSRMTSQINGLNQAISNANNANSMVQTMSGAMSQIQSNLQTMRELAVQASDGSNTDSDRSSLNEEFQQLSQEIGQIAGQTQFNGTSVLNGSAGATVSVTANGANLATSNGIVDIVSQGASVTTGNYTLSVSGTALTLSLGSTSESINIGALPTGFNTQSVAFTQLGVDVTVNSSLTNVSTNNTFQIAQGALTFQIGANEGQTLSLSTINMTTGANGLNISTADISSQSDASTAIDTIQTALNNMLNQEGYLGAVSNRLNAKVANLNNEVENTTSAQSQIQDANYASETAQMSKDTILQQAGISVLAQANQEPQLVLKLLQ